MCRWCTYADVVTSRFENHLITKHDRVIDVEPLFKPCVVFWSLYDCNVNQCGFVTNTEAKLEEHKPTHDDEPDTMGMELTVQLSDLSVDLQRLVLQQQRHRMGEFSGVSKTIERVQGLHSPPLELTLDRPTQEVRPQITPPVEQEPRRQKKCKRVSGFGRGKLAVEVVEEKFSAPTTPEPMEDATVVSPTTQEQQPVVTRTRRRVKKENKKPEDITPARRERIIRAQRELYCALRNRPRFPQRVPFKLPIEKAAKIRSRARYIAELSGGERKFFMCFYALMPACHAVLINRREDEAIDVVQGVSVEYHVGAPETYRAGEPTTIHWNITGPLYDVGTRPWAVVRKLQLSSTPDPKLYVLFNPETMARYNTEVFKLEN